MSPIFGRSDRSTTSLITWWSTFLIFQSWTLSASHVFCRRISWAKWKRLATPAEAWSPLRCVPGWLIATCSASLWDGMIVIIGSWWYINILQGTSLCKYIHFTPHIYRDLYVAITLFDYPIYACLQRNSLLIHLSSAMNMFIIGWCMLARREGAKHAWSGWLTGSLWIYYALLASLGCLWGSLGLLWRALGLRNPKP